MSPYFDYCNLSIDRATSSISRLPEYLSKFITSSAYFANILFFNMPKKVQLELVRESTESRIL